MFCGNCGTKNKEGDVFCTSCGESKKQVENATAQKTATPSSQPVEQKVRDSKPPTYQAAPSPSVGTAGRTPGEMILTVMGILIIIAAVSSFFSAISGLLGGFGGTQATHIINLLVSPYLCYMGFIGLRDCNNLEKASMLQTLGGIAIAIAFVTMIISLATTGVNALPGAVVALLRPALFVIGARKNQ